MAETPRAAAAEARPRTRVRSAGLRIPRSTPVRPPRAAGATGREIRVRDRPCFERARLHRLLKNSFLRRFVSGHDFRCADKSYIFVIPSRLQPAGDLPFGLFQRALQPCRNRPTSLHRAHFSPGAAPPTRFCLSTRPTAIWRAPVRCRTSSPVPPARAYPAPQSAHRLRHPPVPGR